MEDPTSWIGFAMIALGTVNTWVMLVIKRRTDRDKREFDRERLEDKATISELKNDLANCREGWDALKKDLADCNEKHETANQQIQELSYRLGQLEANGEK